MPSKPARLVARRAATRCGSLHARQGALRKRQALKQAKDLPEVVAGAGGLQLAACKSLRDFAPVSGWSGARPKSSLDGLRESALPEPKGAADAGRYASLRRPGRRTACGVGLRQRYSQRGRDDSSDRVCRASQVAARSALKHASDKDKCGARRRKVFGTGWPWLR
ncbi:MAG: hypothetical protein CFK52_11905 [Chloracidobacterium sp. CP2_5A]|nr:MAG: hypothetical protein CFK52_11905 [Chloracidobacterium sp. CP2_5A]